MKRLYKLFIIFILLLPLVTPASGTTFASSPIDEGSGSGVVYRPITGRDIGYANLTARNVKIGARDAPRYSSPTYG